MNAWTWMTLVMASVVLWMATFTYYYHQPKEQPEFEPKEYDLFKNLYEFDLVFQDWFDQKIVRHERSFFATSSSFNIRFIVIEHDDKVDHVLAKREPIANSLFNLAISLSRSLPATTRQNSPAVWNATCHYLEVLASKRARELNLYVGFLAGDYSILAQPLMSDSAYAEHVKMILAQIDLKINEIITKLAPFDPELSAKAENHWEALLAAQTPLMLPTCPFKVEPTEFYRIFFQNEGEKTHLDECFKTNPFLRSMTSATMVAVTFFYVVIVIAVAPCLRRIGARKYKIMENEQPSQMPCQMPRDTVDVDLMKF